MKFASVLLAVSCLLSAAFAVQPSFDAREVVRQVRGETRPGPGVEMSLDDGEFLIDTCISYVPAPSEQWFPAVGFDGTNFLVVWEDYRGGTSPHIYGCRVTPGGDVLDPKGIPISVAASYQWFPAVSFDGTNFLVVWQDGRSGSSDIYGCRVTPEGVVLEPDGIPISTAVDDQECPAVVFDGTNFLVVWQDYRNGDTSDICGARVTPAGVVVDTNGISISTAASSQGYPAVGFDGTNYLVVWTDYRSDTADIYGARVSLAGTVLDPSGIAISTATMHQAGPGLAFDGTNFLVVWQDGRSGGDSSDIYGARVSPAGAVLDPNGIAISTAAYSQKSPAVSFDGANYLVAWGEDDPSGSDDIYGARVTPAGVVLDSAGIVIATNGDYPALAFDGENFLVTWSTGDIHGARVTPAGVVLDPNGILISTIVNSLRSPEVAFDGTNFLVVWVNYRGGSGCDIYCARVSQAGTVLDSAGIPTSTGAYDQLYPAVAFDGTNCLVVWEDWRSGLFPDIYGCRATPGGVVLEPYGIQIGCDRYSQASPALGFDGTNYLVVWDDNLLSYADIFGARVSQAGVVHGRIPISTAAYYQELPAVAFDGTNFLVVWQDYRNGVDYDIYGARVTPAGTVLDPSGIAISTATMHQAGPSLAFDGTNFLVVWQDGRSGGDSSDIYGARVSSAGAVLDTSGIVISQAANGQWSPAIAFDGTNFLVVWTDSRSGSSWDIYGAWVQPDGTVFDESPLVTQEGNQSYPALARGNGSQIFLVYQGWAGTVGNKTYNTDRIWGKMNPAPGLQEAMDGERGTAKPGPTIVRGVLVLGAVGRRQNAGDRAILLDAAGRKVMDLQSGANDVSGLAPGVYFCTLDDGPAKTVRKVVLTE
jgi:hypothetical protein